MPAGSNRYVRECAVAFLKLCSFAVQIMGDKTSARNLAIECGVPIIMGTNEPLEGVEDARKFALACGYPVMLKAAMGGGGRGMRVVTRSASVIYFSKLTKTFFLDI